MVQQISRQVDALQTGISRTCARTREVLADGGSAEGAVSSARARSRSRPPEDAPPEEAGRPVDTPADAEEERGTDGELLRPVFQPCRTYHGCCTARRVRQRQQRWEDLSGASGGGGLPPKRAEVRRVSRPNVVPEVGPKADHVPLGYTSRAGSWHRSRPTE